MLAGPTEDIEVIQNPTNWISSQSWNEIYRNVYGMRKLKNF